jgi:polysaccharide deacetylase 2 family uncharacterized protein YibQ
MQFSLDANTVILISLVLTSLIKLYTDYRDRQWLKADQAAKDAKLDMVHAATLEAKAASAEAVVVSNHLNSKLADNDKKLETVLEVVGKALGLPKE